MLNNGHILTAEEMRRAEQDVMDAGISIEELMKRAGSGAAQHIWRISGRMPTIVACGPGNNGGDGYVIAQWLLEKGVETVVAAMGEPTTEVAQKAKLAWKGTIVPFAEASPAPQLVDCLFGTGLTRPIDNETTRQFLTLAAAATRNIAVDMPSGIHSDNGLTLSDVPQFHQTIALGAYKPAHYLEPARSLQGDLIAVDIGIRSKSRTRSITRPEIEAPASTSHKYTRGLVVIVAGKMKGAAQLAALGAQKSGAGYVKIFANGGCTAPNNSIVVEIFEDSEQLKNLLTDSRISAVVLGPGLGRDKSAEHILETVIDIPKPLLLDADALVLLGKGMARAVSARASPTVATPHSGEFAEMSASDAESKIERVRLLARESYSTILLKGSDTVVADSVGHASLAAANCRWLSTAGTGDVLSGIIGTRLSAGTEPIHAAEQAQWLHTRAAQLAGPAFSPEQLVDHIPAAIQECL
ncbi:NAD(P)H-hydrate dehydratase [Parasphingorhabdus sp.]|uniref:NAD(P)H-hydrate dehydratase n=1 Tax=Parasphingorhabdus sp. TaxID=2709688 RepID=UPI003267888A